MSLESPKEQKLSYDEIKNAVSGYYRTLKHNLQSGFEFPTGEELELKNQAIERVTKLILDPEFQQAIRERDLAEKLGATKDALQMAIDAGCSDWDYAIASQLVKELVLG